MTGPRMSKEEALVQAVARFGSSAWVDRSRAEGLPAGIRRFRHQVGDLDGDGRQRLRGSSLESFEKAFADADRADKVAAADAIARRDRETRRIEEDALGGLPALAGETPPGEPGMADPVQEFGAWIVREGAWSGTPAVATAWYVRREAGWKSIEFPAADAKTAAAYRDALNRADRELRGGQ